MNETEAKWRLADVRGTPATSEKLSVLRAVENEGFCAHCDATGQCACGCGKDCDRCGGSGRLDG